MGAGSDKEKPANGLEELVEMDVPDSPRWVDLVQRLATLEREEQAAKLAAKDLPRRGIGNL